MRDPLIVSRRRLLQSAGAVLAAGVFGPARANAAEVSAVMATLSTFMSEAAGPQSSRSSR